MHQFFADALLKWFFDNFLVLADSFILVSIHCVARGLGASFLYKCPASRGSSLRQHGFLVKEIIYGNYVCLHNTRPISTSSFLVHGLETGITEFLAPGITARQVCIFFLSLFRVFPFFVSFFLAFTTLNSLTQSSEIPSHTLVLTYSSRRDVQKGCAFIRG